MFSRLALLSDLRSWGLHVTLSSGLEKTTYLKWSLNFQPLVGCAIQNWLTMYRRKIKCISWEKKKKLEMYVLFISFFFPFLFVFLIIFESGSMRKCLWIGLKIHAVPGFYLPLTSPGFWIHGADSWNRTVRTVPSLYKCDWLTRPH